MKTQVLSPAGAADVWSTERDLLHPGRVLWLVLPRQSHVGGRGDVV